MHREGAPGTSWWRPFVSLAAIDVVHVDLAPAAELDRAACAWLDQSERERWQRYRVESARRQFARCRAALRAGLCERLGCRNDRLAFGAGKHGKLFARVEGRDARAAFNVSHSGEHGLIAYGADGVPIGVDLETRETRADLRSVSETVFGIGERSALARLADREWTHLFFRLWTMNEALIKALGTGFTLDPARFEVPPAMLDGASSSPFRFPQAPQRRWMVADLGEARFAAALAWETDTGAHDR